MRISQIYFFLNSLFEVHQEVSPLSRCRIQLREIGETNHLKVRLYSKGLFY